MVTLVKWDKPQPPTEQEAEARLHAEGYEVFRWHDVPGSGYPKHKHEYDECLWILRGSITFNVDGRDYPLNPGDRLYLPHKTPHTAQVPMERAVVYLVGKKTP